MKPIKGFPNYFITPSGQVFSKKSNKFLKHCPHPKGYLQVKLYDKYINKNKTIHRLVAETYLENPLNKKEVNHINGIKTDNRVENLEWVTKNENINHYHNSPLYIENNNFNGKRSKIIIDLNTGILYNSMKEASTLLDINYQTFVSKVKSKYSNYKLHKKTA